MATKKVGVEPREKSIRLRFTFEGAVFRKTLDMEPTIPNIKAAKRMAAKIEKEIADGVFVMSEHFPDSEDPQAFGTIADQWLKSKGQLVEASVDQYGSAVRFWKRMFGEDTNVAKLTYAVISSKIGSYPWLSPKQHNNYLIALRGIMDMEYRGRKAVENPLIGISNLKAVKKIPDPLTRTERDRILTYMQESYDERVWAYFAFAFATGMRPEEIIALRWSDWDRDSGTIRVQRVRTFKGSERDGSKTHAERDVDLTPAAVAALEVMLAYTFGAEDTDIFERPAWHPKPGSRGGRPSEAGPWTSEREQRDQFWKPALLALGIRGRRAYCTRHTYCTLALMGGVLPAYIAAQAGHSVKMLLEVYSKWVPGDDGGVQRRRLADAQGLPSNFPKAPENTGLSYENPGRRNWTRTKRRL